jgi:hypothetical protein
MLSSVVRQQKDWFQLVSLGVAGRRATGLSLLVKIDLIALFF